VPAEGIDGVGFEGNTGDGCWGDLGGLDEVAGFGLFDPAPAPEGDHAGEGEDGKASSAELGFAIADFAIGEAQESGKDEGDQEQAPDDWFGDEYEVAGVPVCIERKERAEAVVVGPVEEEMTEVGEEGRDPDPDPANGLAHDDIAHGGAAGCPEAGAEAINQPHCAGGSEGYEGRGEEGVGDTAMVLQASDGASPAPDYVEVGSIGGENCGEGGIGGTAVEAGAADAGAGEDVRDWLHGGLILAGGWD